VKRALAIVREALATARAQPVASIIAIVMVAGMCATVLLTTGRTVGAEQAVLKSIDSAGTRSIVITADTDAELDTSVLSRLANIDGIEWAAAFGAARDVTNASVPGGTKVPVRLAWGENMGLLGIPKLQPVPNGTGWASDAALEKLGMPDGAGGVLSVDGAEYAITGRIRVPDQLAFLEPLVIVPQTPDSAATTTVTVLVVVATRPDLVSPVSRAVQSILAVPDRTKITLSTSESLATLRALVQGQLGSFGRNLVVVIFALTAMLMAAILYGLVMLRRKDFGRRRALGASQGLIMCLVLTQMTALSIVGAGAGIVSATVWLLAAGDPLPGPDFVVGIAVLAVGVGLAATLVPAIAAARREPLKELRVP
jgi:putative ABC transport system permease protein